MRALRCGLSLLGFVVCTNLNKLTSVAEQANLTIALMAPYFNDRHRDVANAFYMTVHEVSIRDN